MLSTPSIALADAVFQMTGQSVAKCYQCGKCSAGCPLSGEMDLPPNQILRLIQYGDPALDAKAVECYSIWLCLSCHTCSARCPQGIDLPPVMDVLRQRSAGTGHVHTQARNIVAFHRSFLKSIRSHGRLFEVGTIASYKFRTGKFFQDLLLAPRILLKGKLGLLPHSVGDRKQVRRVFESTDQ